MEKLAVTRRKGGSIESRSAQAYSSQHGYALQGKKDSWNGVGVPLERGGKRPATPAQGRDWKHEAIQNRSRCRDGSGSFALQAQRGQAAVEPKAYDVRRTGQSLSQPRTSEQIEVHAQDQQDVYQQLDRSGLAWVHRQRVKHQ